MRRASSFLVMATFKVYEKRLQKTDICVHIVIITIGFMQYFSYRWQGVELRLLRHPIKRTTVVLEVYRAGRRAFT